MKKFTRIGIPHIIVGALLLAVSLIGLRGLNIYERQQANVTPTPVFAAAAANTEMRDFAPMRLSEPGNQNSVFLPLVSRNSNLETPDTVTPEQAIGKGIVTYDDPTGAVQCHLSLAYETWTDLDRIIRLPQGTNVVILAEAEAPTVWNGSREVYLVRPDEQTGQTCYLRKELLQVQDIQQ